MPERPSTTPLATIGPYVLLREIGRGSYGIVYHAEDSRLRRRVALKVLRSPGRRRAQGPFRGG